MGRPALSRFPSGNQDLRLRTARRRRTEVRTGRRQSASRRCRKNPMGATDLYEIRRLRIGQTLGRRPNGTPLREDPRAEARGGDRCDAGCSGGAEGRAPEGNAPGPRSGRRSDATARRRASSDPASRCLSPSDPQSWRSKDPGGNGSRGVRQRITARRPNRSRMSAGTPWTAAAPLGRTASGEETVEEARNLEDGTCRGRQPREGTDPPAHVVEGAQNPRRGDLGREAVVRTAEECPERGPSLREPLRTFGSGAER